MEQEWLKGRDGRTKLPCGAGAGAALAADGRALRGKHQALVSGSTHSFI